MRKKWRTVGSSLLMFAVAMVCVYRLFGGSPIGSTYLGLASVLIGFSAITFRKGFARQVAESQNKIWGRKYSEMDIKVTEVLSIIVGSGFAAWGLMVFFGILEF